jgi:hypothetical protein
MSYCRRGPDSDVYAWSGQYGDSRYWVVETDADKVVCHSVKDFCTVLSTLAYADYRIPEEAILRAYKELKEE